jgi:hypothetical protein
MDPEDDIFQILCYGRFPRSDLWRSQISRRSAKPVACVEHGSKHKISKPSLAVPEDCVSDVHKYEMHGDVYKRLSQAMKNFQIRFPCATCV